MKVKLIEKKQHFLGVYSRERWQTCARTWPSSTSRSIGPSATPAFHRPPSPPPRRRPKPPPTPTTSEHRCPNRESPRTSHHSAPSATRSRRYRCPPWRPAPIRHFPRSPGDGSPRPVGVAIKMNKLDDAQCAKSNDHTLDLVVDNISYFDHMEKVTGFSATNTT